MAIPARELRVVEQEEKRRIPWWDNPSILARIALAIIATGLTIGLLQPQPVLIPEDRPYVSGEIPQESVNP